MADLFWNSEAQATRIEIPDADLLFFERAVEESQAQNFFVQLVTAVSWREEEVVVWGKRHKQPRLVAWYGDPGAVYTYSGSTLHPNAWTEMLLSLRAIVEARAGGKFNSVLLNLYRDGADYMGWHSDDEPSLGAAPLIASLSLGAPRVFQMKHKRRQELGVKSLTLTNGSLLVMAGATQKHWLHSIKKENRSAGQRINLTFRQIHLSTEVRHG